jgi:exosortase family protein XrtM
MTGYSFAWRFIAFVGIFELAYLWLSATALWPLFIHGFTTLPSSLLIDAIVPALHVLADGTRIVSDRVSINVQIGCDGTEVLVLLFSAQLASRASFAATVLGIVAATGFIFVINLARIAVLYLVLLQAREYFSLVHGLLAPIVIIVLAWLFFRFWAGRYVSRGEELQRRMIDGG